jgi:hypothetical protein
MSDDATSNTTWTPNSNTVLDVTDTVASTDGVTIIGWRAATKTGAPGPLVLGGTWGASGTTNNLAVEILPIVFADPISSIKSITPDGAFGNPQVSQTAPPLVISPAGIASDEKLSSPQVSNVVAPSGIVSFETSGVSAVTPGTVTISPSGIPSTEADGVAGATPGTVTASLAGIASGELDGYAVSLSPSQGFRQGTSWV